MTTLTLENILGGGTALKKKPHSSLDLVALIRNGLPAASIDSVTKAVSLTLSELGMTLGIPGRTLARRKKKGKLDPKESEKVVRLARVVRRAVEVFEKQDLAIDWLKHPNRALRNQTPLSLLDTEFGAESVMDLLGRIGEGVFS